MVYPPYCDICTVTFTSELNNKAYSGSKTFFEMLKEAVSTDYSDVKINVLGPIQPRVGKISNKFRYVLTIKCKNNKRFRSMMSDLLIKYMRTSQNSGVSAVIDIN